MSSTIDCPKCGHEHDPDPEIQDMATQCCDECGFEFDVYVDFEPVYSTQCTECYFGDWEQHTANGTVVMRRWCRNCSGLEEKGEVPMQMSGGHIAQNDCIRLYVARGADGRNHYGKTLEEAQRLAAEGEYQEPQWTPRDTPWPVPWQQADGWEGRQ